VVILLGFTHFFGDKIKNDENFRTIVVREL